MSLNCIGAGQALTPAQLARDACAKRGSHMGVDARANRCSQTDWGSASVMHALA